MLMSKKVIFATAAAALLVLLGIAVAIVLSREPSGGSLDTALSDVTVIPPTFTVATPTTPKPPAVKVDRRCWTTFGGDSALSLARSDIDIGIPARKLWARGLKSYIEFPPVYCNGVLYVNTYRGDTWAIEARTGDVVWLRRNSAVKPSSPAIAGRYLLVSAKDGSVTALDRRNGRVVWRVVVNSIVESSPAVVGRTAYFGANDGRLFAINTANGRIRWAYDTGGRINSSPSVWGNRVCITTYSGSIFCLNAKNGQKLWDTYIKRDSFRYESFYASASTDGPRLYTIARSGRVVALKSSNGDVLWTRNLNSLGYSTPAIGRDRIFVGDFRGSLHALSKTTGEEIWRANIGSGRILGPALVVGPLVFFSTLEQRTYAARVSDGKIVWELSIGKYAPGIATERAYYFSLNGILVAFPGRKSPR